MQAEATPTVQTPAPKKKRHSLRTLLIILLAVLAVLDGIQYYRIERAIRFAESCLGLPYVWGSVGDDSYDCSGLTMKAYAAAGVTLPRRACDQGTDEHYRCIDSISGLRRGDLVAWDTIDDYDPSDHVGIYLGGNKVLHASSGKKKVMISDMEGYFTEHFTCGRRILPHL